jgi:hypothetical protein
MKGLGGTGGGMILGPVNDMVDKDILVLGVEDKCPNLARAATSKAETAGFSEVFEEVSKYNKQFQPSKWRL